MPRRDWPLYLHEELMLLALRDEEGTTLTSGEYLYALAAAVLHELIASGRLRLVVDKKKSFIEALDSRPLGDAVLEEALAKIAAAKRRAQLKDWVAKLAGLKRLKPRVTLALCRRGILRADERTILFIFKQQVYPEADPRPERAIRERLRRAIFTPATDLDARTRALLALADAVGLLPSLFEKRRLKERRAHIKRLVEPEPLGKVVRDAVAAARSAAATAAVVATTS